MESETAEAIDVAAARWVARFDRIEQDPAMAAEFEAWLAGDTRRRGALIRAQACWLAIDGSDPIEVVPGHAWSRRRMMVAGGGAVAAALLAGVGWRELVDNGSLATATGERRRTRLADGSTMMLNTASTSHVAISDIRRSVVLDAGEAWFHVAKDKARPFVVAAGAVRAEAVGTAFAVRRLADRAEVLVTEGRVRVWSVAAPSRFLLLDAGKRAWIDDVGGAAVAEVKDGGIADALAWRSGEIVLDGMTLGDAAAEFNRYNRRQLAIEAPLSERKFVGRFRTEEVDSFAKSAAAMTGARIEQDGDVVRIVQ